MVILISILSIIILLVAVSFHEYGHAWVATRLGDPTAKEAGRLTLNPIAHIDPVGMILVPILLIITIGVPFGWAKPVPINFAYLRNPRKDMAWIGLAGPTMNILLAVVLAMLQKMGLATSGLIGFFVIRGAQINLILAVLNLIPVPPLDGSRILTGLLPREYAYSYMRIEPFGIIIILALFWLGFLDRVIVPVVNSLCKVLGVPPLF